MNFQLKLKIPFFIFKIKKKLTILKYILKKKENFEINFNKISCIIALKKYQDNK